MFEQFQRKLALVVKKMSKYDTSMQILQEKHCFLEKPAQKVVQVDALIIL